LTLAGVGLGSGTADSIAAIVGDEVILASEVEQAVDFLRVAYPDSAASDSALRAGVLSRMIDDFVLQAEAQRESVEVAASEVAAEVDANIATLVERFGGMDGFRQALLQEGLTEKALRQRYLEESRRRLLSRRLLEKAGLTQIYISPGETERFYNENRDSVALVPGRVTLSHILFLIRPSAAAESAGMRRMSEVMDVLVRGGDFATVAGSFSEDKRTAGRGGDWGWKETTELSPDVAMVVAQLKPGQVSPPFRTLDGYLTLRLTERRSERVRVRSILIRVPLGRADSTRARNLAESVRRKATTGAAFDSLARLYSEDPATRDSGGYLGDFMLKGLTPPFDQVVRDMDSGEVCEPVLSEHGYHLVKVLATEPERVMSYLEMQDGIRNYLYQQRLNERLRSYIDRVSQKVYVKR
jgi:peptidyl-prolyl cis-trans isomerase SurA